MTYKSKYLKYKLKYLNLKKKLYGGMDHTTPQKKEVTNIFSELEELDKTKELPKGHISLVTLYKHLNKLFNKFQDLNFDGETNSSDESSDNDVTLEDWKNAQINILKILNDENADKYERIHNILLDIHTSLDHALDE